MTNLLYLYPDIPFSARQITPSSATSLDLNEFNLISGPRTRYFQFAATATTRSIVFDLGGNYASGQATVNYLSLARADLLQAAGVTQIQLDSSPDNSAWTNRINVTSFGSQTLYGPNVDDFVTTIATTAAFRYWRITYTAGSAINFKHSKDYFGTSFDFGVDPADCEISRPVEKTSPFVSDSGSRYGERVEAEKYTFTMYYEGLSDLIIKNWENSVMRPNYRENGIFLYTSGQHQILDNQRLVHCELLAYEVQKSRRSQNWNDLRLDFQELQG